MPDLNAQKSLVEAALQVHFGNTQNSVNLQENVVEETTEASGTEELVYEYLSSFFGVDLNESIDEITEEQLEEAVESINVLCSAINEYFELDENMYLAPKKGKGKAAAKKMY